MPVANRATIKITDHDDSDGANALDDVDPRQFEKRAEQIGFAKPLVKRRVIDQAKKVLKYLPGVDVAHPVPDEIRKVCRRLLRGGVETIFHMMVTD